MEMTIRPKPPQKVEEKYDLGYLNLYREELIAITRAVAELGEVSIECDNSEATSPEDFNNLPEELRWVSIKSQGTSGTSIKVLLSHSAALVTVSYPNTLTAGILTRLRDIAKNSRRPFRSLIPQSEGFQIARYTISVIAWFALVVDVLVFSTHPHSKNWTQLEFGITSWSGSAVLLAAFIIGRLQKLTHVLITNAPRAERPSYWQRNGDTWVIGLITAVIGAVIGYFLGKVS
jgi:hypothetical protein